LRFKTKTEEAAAAIIAAVLSALLFFLGNGLTPVWPLLWFAPLPVLLFALRGSLWSTGAVAFFAVFISGLNFWHYLRVLGAPPVAWAIVFGTGALIFAAIVLVFRALARRHAFWSALLAVPAMWVSFEYIRNLTTPHGTAGSFAYSQLSFLPFLQVASLTGPWGMSFLLLLFPAAIAIAIHLRRTDPKRALRIAGVSFGIIAAALVFGGVRLAIPQSGPVVRVGLVASDAPGNVYIAAKGPETDRLLRGYAAEAEKLSVRGAQFIVLPEKLGTILDADANLADRIFQPLADRSKSTIVVGLVHVSSPVEYNQARVYAPGAPVRSYDKRHMLPPVELKFTPGTSLTMLPGASGLTGVAICKDMDFARPSWQYGQAGAGLMLVPAWDFNLDRAWHGHIAIMRGVEDGFSVVRAAKQGLLTVSDNRGRILAEQRSDAAPFATLLAGVSTGHSPTLYVLAGNWFAWLALALAAFTVVQLFRLRKAAVVHPSKADRAVPARA
jgi:apolipoprotein N-acyltransferase